MHDPTPTADLLGAIDQVQHGIATAGTVFTWFFIAIVGLALYQAIRSRRDP